MKMAFKNPVSVDELLRTPFGAQKYEEQFRIVSEGKPRPSLKMLSVIVRQEQEIETQDFNMSLYDEIQWLTGCPKRNKIFCWPCLLFEKPGLWNSTGISEIIYVIERKSEHEITEAHMDAMISLQMFIYENKISRNETLVRNENGKKKKIKERLIDVCCATFQQISNDGSLTSNTLDKQACLKLMTLLRNYDAHEKNLSDEAINLITMNPKIIDYVAYGLTQAVKLVIYDEVQLSTYASLILSQYSDARSKPKISTILRFVRNGEIFERFVSFCSMPCSLTTDSVLQHILNILEEYKISEKLCAVSLDGAVLPIDALIPFVEKLKESIPHCHFVPWYSRSVDYILQQSLSSISACGQFFKFMSSMHIYFKENSELFLDSIRRSNSRLLSLWCNKTLFSEGSNGKFASADFIKSVKILRQSFIEFFNSIITDCNIWDADKMAKAYGFQRYLQDLQTIFLLEVFSRIFKITSSLEFYLRDDKLYYFEKNVGHQLKMNLSKMHSGSFNELWDSMKKEIASRSDLVKVYNLKINQYIALFNSIMMLTIRNIKFRCEELDKFKFCNMFNFENSGGLEHLKYIKSFKETYKREINEELMLNELSALWEQKVHFNNSLIDLYQFLIMSTCHHTYKTLIDVLEFILTIPIKPANGISNVSKLQTVEKWSNGYVGNANAHADISMLCIESSIFEAIMQSSTFYDKIMDVFDWTVQLG